MTTKARLISSKYKYIIVNNPKYIIHTTFFTFSYNWIMDYSMLLLICLSLYKMICNSNGDFYLVGWSRQLWKMLFTLKLRLLINLRAEPSFEDGGRRDTAPPSSGDSKILQSVFSYYKPSLLGTNPCQLLDLGGSEKT